MKSAAAFAGLLLVLLPATGFAEVSRVEIAARRDVLGGREFGSTGAYELLTGRVHFVIDPRNPRNQVITDLDKAPKNDAGLVELSADLSILKPRDTSRGNGVALFDIVNRGRRTVLTGFDRAGGSGDLTTEAEFGDGFLLRRGYTIVWVGWEFDVPQRPNAVRIDVPSAAGITGAVRAYLTPESNRAEAAFGDGAAYSPSEPASDANALRVRDGVQGEWVTVPRGQWRFAGDAVWLDGGFTAGRTYELTFLARNPPIAGLGFAAVRDVASWLKHEKDASAPVRYAYAFGASQSGRFLRDFLYHGFNSDERDRQVLDGVMAHIAGAARTDLNQRWATPTALATYTATSFPFSDRKLKDPASGGEEGALDNARVHDGRPKIFYTNTGVEYWGGGRSAALTHTTPDGSTDLQLPEYEREYFLAGAQHTPSRFPTSVVNGQQKDNPLDYWWTLRALLVAMDGWVRDGVAPPPSRYPRLADGTLVRAAAVAFPLIPGVASPRMVRAGVRASNHLASAEGAPGTLLPLLVPQVDADGNERAGVRLPDLAAPLATYTGWNFRNPRIGAPSDLYPLLGSYVPFAGTKAERSARDPRLSIVERYTTREAYLRRIDAAAAALVKDRYVLAEDTPGIARHAAEHWDMLIK